MLLPKEFLFVLLGSLPSHVEPPNIHLIFSNFVAHQMTFKKIHNIDESKYSNKMKPVAKYLAQKQQIPHCFHGYTARGHKVGAQLLQGQDFQGYEGRTAHQL